MDVEFELNLIKFNLIQSYTLDFIRIKLKQESAVKLVDFRPLEGKETPTESHMSGQ